MPVPALILADIGSLCVVFASLVERAARGCFGAASGYCIYLMPAWSGVERISSTYRSTADLGLLSSPNNASEDRFLISIPRLELRECD
jgi:hypothetical protein